MAKICQKCGKQVSYFQGVLGKTICNECMATEKAERKRIEAEYQTKLILIRDEIIKMKKIIEQDLELLKKCKKSDQIRLYNDIWTNFTTDKEMDKNELETLIQLQKELGLSNEEIQFEERIMPYQYIYLIRTENKLPIIKFEDVGGGKIILKKMKQPTSQFLQN